MVTFTTTNPQLLQDKNLPPTIEIDLAVDPEKIGPYTIHEFHNYNSKGFNGHQYPDEINHWFSTAIEKKVVMIRAKDMSKTKARNDKFFSGRKDDLVKSFLGESPLHVVNFSSMRDLESGILNNPNRTDKDDFHLTED